MPVSKAGGPDGEKAEGQWTDYGLMMAEAALTSLPTILIFLASQRYFLQGITVGAIKG